MGYNIIKAYEENRKKERDQEFALERIWAAQAPQRAASKLAHREAVDKWSTREKPGPAGAEYFWERGPNKLSTAVPFSDESPYYGAERQRAIQAAKVGVIPREPAATEKTRAEAEKIRYGTKFERSTRGILEDILRSQADIRRAEAGEAGLGVSEMRRDIRLRGEAEERAEIEAAMPSIIEPEAPAKPGRKMRPGLRRALWKGTPTKSGLTLPGLGAPLYGYKNIADWLGAGMKKGYEYAFPRTK